LPKLLVIEANEIPPKVFHRFAALRPDSALARLIGAHGLIETEAGDVSEQFLYPSQSWASFNTGRSYDEHRIHWYNDVKDYNAFYWHALAATGHSTVLVNTLHSSPLKSYVGDGNYKLVLPDCFAPDSDALPARFAPFQAFNASAAVLNGRKAFLSSTLAAAAKSVLRDPRPSSWGVSSESVIDLSQIGAAVAAGQRERLRLAQFPVLASIFLRAMKQHLPELGVLFTNHVAAMMHRYWYAAFPEDFAKAAYPSEWIERYRGEIFVAMDLLDRWIGRFERFANKYQYTMLIVTSMGQAANQDVTKEGVVENNRDYRISDPKKFIGRLLRGIGKPVFESAMIPQYTFAFPSEQEARTAVEYLDRIAFHGITLTLDRSETKVTVSALVRPDETGEIRADNESLTLAELGIVAFEIDDHHSGRHHPIGSLIVANDGNRQFADWKGRINYLDYAPAVRSFFQ
jgi:hypothetical protein